MPSAQVCLFQIKAHKAIREYVCQIAACNLADPPHNAANDSPKRVIRASHAQSAEPVQSDGSITHRIQDKRWTSAATIITTPSDGDVKRM
eukprot:SAG31_NODE_1089_length_9972_cov_4.602856_10_plen_90_part_00